MKLYKIVFYSNSLKTWSLLPKIKYKDLLTQYHILFCRCNFLFFLEGGCIFCSSLFTSNKRQCVVFLFQVIVKHHCCYSVFPILPCELLLVMIYISICFCDVDFLCFISIWKGVSGTNIHCVWETILSIQEKFAHRNSSNRRITQMIMNDPHVHYYFFKLDVFLTIFCMQLRHQND